jgi:hypothetical protein
MTTRIASCSCGQLRLRCEGDPVRVSVCHCLACQRRTGSAFGAQARYLRARVEREGGEVLYERAADSGNAVTFRFCPACGATVYWSIPGLDDAWIVALGAFADPTFPAPTVSIYEERQHAWVALPGDGVTHLA